MARVKIKTGPHRPSSLSPWCAPFADRWGIYVGDGCVTGAEPLEWKTVLAHAHNDVEDEWFGWVCVADPYDVITTKGQPTVTLKHEIAHILCKNGGHTALWRTVPTSLGAPSEAKKYERKQNGKSCQSQGITSGTGLGSTP